MGRAWKLFAIFQAKSFFSNIVDLSAISERGTGSKQFRIHRNKNISQDKSTQKLESMGDRDGESEEKNPNSREWSFS